MSTPWYTSVSSNLLPKSIYNYSYCPKLKSLELVIKANIFSVQCGEKYPKFATRTFALTRKSKPHTHWNKVIPILNAIVRIKPLSKIKEHKPSVKYRNSRIHLNTRTRTLSRIWWYMYYHYWNTVTHTLSQKKSYHTKLSNCKFQ